MAIIAMSRQLGGLGMVDGAEAAKRLNYDCVQEEIISPNQYITSRLICLTVLPLPSPSRV